MIEAAILLLLLKAAPDSTGPAADSTSHTVVRVRGVEVRGERPRPGVRESSPTSFVSEQRTGVSGHAIETLADLLAADPATRLTRYGGLGAFTTVSLRGAAAGHVAVIVDGVPLQSAGQGIADLATVPMAAVARVEIHRSLVPPALGPPLPGGAVVLRLHDDVRHQELHLARGSFGSTEARAALARRVGPLAALGVVGYLGSNGDYDYPDDNGTPQNAADDSVVARANNRVDAWSALARLAGSAFGVGAVVRGEAYHQAQGVPGPGSVPTPHPRRGVDRGAIVGELSRGGGRGPRLLLRALTQGERTRFRDREGELGLGRQESDERFGARAIALESASGAWRGIELGAGGELRRDRAEAAPYTLGAPPPPASVRDARAAWLSLQFGGADDPLVLQASNRWDEHVDHLRASGVAGVLQRRDVARALAAPQAGARLRLAPGLELRANHARTRRAPGFVELFGQQGGVQSNLQLVPERSDRWDAGLVAAGRLGAVRWSAEGARFGNFVRDLIVFQRSGPSTVRARNVGRAALRGEEWSVRAAWGGFEAAGTTAWLSALDVTDPSIYRGLRLPQRAERQWSARIAARRGVARAHADIQCIGDDFLDPANRTRVPPRAFLGGAVGLALAGLDWTLEGRNLLDERASDVIGFPLPGRSVFVAVATPSTRSFPGEP